MNNICTSFEQSKKLIELGIDVNTADMCWTNHLFNAFLSSWRIESTSPQEYKNLLDRFAVRGYLIEPAWSLTALLDMLTEQDFVIKTVGNEFNIDIPIRRCKIWFSSLLDAAFEMVCWLKENNEI